MRKQLRKAISLLCAIVVTVSCLSVSAFVSAESTNLAVGQTVFVDSANNSGAPSKVVDGSTAQGSRWQSKKNFAGGPYFGISFDEPQDVGGLVLYWHSDSPAADGVKVSVCYTQPTLAVLDQTLYEETCYTDNGTQWTVVDTSLSRVAATESNKNVKWKDTITFSEDLTGVYAIRIDGTKRGAGGTNMSCFEVEVYGRIDTVPYSTAQINDALTYVSKAFSTSNSYGYSDASWTAFDEARTEAALVATLCEGANVGDVEDYPTQEDVDAVANALLAAAASLTGTGTNTSSNVMENGIMIYDTDDLQFSGGHNLRTLTDGAWTPSGNNCWQPKKKTSSVYIKLPNASAMNEMVLFAERVKEIYTIEYTTANVTNITDMAGMAALSWTDTNATMEYNVSYASEVAYSFYTFEKITGVTAIRLTCSPETEGATCKLREVQAYCDENGANTTIQDPTIYASSDGTQRFYAIAVDKNDTETGHLTATYTITTANGSVTDTVTISTSYAAVSLGGTLITAGDLNGTHNGDYVTGVLFTNLDPAVEYDIQVSFDLN